MAIVTLKELKMALKAQHAAGQRNHRLMGIDHSKRAWGLALSNPDLTLSTPFKTIVCTKFTQDVEKLSTICKEYAVTGFVIGLPLNMDGSSSGRTDSVRHFADNLLKAKTVFDFEPLIAFCDERLSTSAADDLLSAHSTRKRNEVVDQLAAQIILQDALTQMAQITD